MEELTATRTYFTLLDEDSMVHPAMEYLAATLDEEPVLQVMPLKRFVKLIASGEPLAPLDDGRYLGMRSGRTYSPRPR